MSKQARPIAPTSWSSDEWAAFQRGASRIQKRDVTHQVENWGRTGGRDRFTTLCVHPGRRFVIALVPPFLATSVWKGLQEVTS